MHGKQSVTTHPHTRSPALTSSCPTHWQMGNRPLPEFPGLCGPNVHLGPQGARKLLVLPCPAIRFSPSPWHRIFPCVPAFWFGLFRHHSVWSTTGAPEQNGPYFCPLHLCGWVLGDPQSHRSLWSGRGGEAYHPRGPARLLGNDAGPLSRWIKLNKGYSPSWDLVYGGLRLRGPRKFRCLASCPAPCQPTSYTTPI